MSSVLVFCARTVPDVVGIRAVYRLPASLSDNEVAEFALQRRRAVFADDALPAHLHRLVCVSFLTYTGSNVILDSFSEPQYEEAALLREVLVRLAQAKGRAVCWDRGRLDSVLQSRALIYPALIGPVPSVAPGQVAHSLVDDWGVPERDATTALEEMSVLCGIPGERSMNGEALWQAYLGGNSGALQADAETDVMRTWLLHLRDAMLHGRTTFDEYAVALAALKDCLQTRAERHCASFLANLSS